MALIRCTECGHEVSDRAAACPRCGAPIRTPEFPATSAAATKSSLAGQTVGIVGLALGIASIVMPYFAAVFLVPAAFVCGLIAFLRRKKALGAMAMILAAVGLASVIYVSQQISNIIEDPFAPSSLLGTNTPPIVTLAEYEQLREGISYEEAVRIIGDEGEELSRSDIAGYSTVMYMWTNAGGSNMNAMFQNGELVTKAPVSYTHLTLPTICSV